MAENHQEFEIDIQKLLIAYWRRLWLILLMAVIVAGAAWVYTVSFVTPMYRASTTLYVSNTKSQEGMESVSGGNLSTAQQLINTYIGILKSDRVLNQVAAELDNRYTADELRSMMSASKQGETEIFAIYVVNADPEAAADIANAMADITCVEIVDLVKGSSAHILDVAKVPATQDSPDEKANILKGALIGAAAAIAYVTLIFLLDFRIKDESDLIALAEYPVIGQIPDFNTVDHVRAGYYAEEKPDGEEEKEK